MNPSPEKKDCCRCAERCAYAISILGCFLIVAALVMIMRHYTRTEPLGSKRADERRKALSELRAENENVLNNPNYAWQDAAKGIVRMPISNAMDMTLKMWQNPAAARSNLISRVEAATVVKPPPSYE